MKGSANTRFLYDGDALVAEYDSAGALTNRYVHGANAAADDPLVWYVGANFATTRHLHADHLGSIVGITNCNASAPCLDAYDEYGVPAAANVGRFQYTGQAWLSELGSATCAGVYYYKARMYSACLGRFLQTDPVGYKDQINLYAYVADDPANRSDPSGNYTCEDKAACDNYEQTKATLTIVARRLGLSSDPVDRAAGRLLQSGMKILGDRDKANGTFVGTTTKQNVGASYSLDEKTLKINLGNFEKANSVQRAGYVGHELVHTVQGRYNLFDDERPIISEFQAYHVTARVWHNLGYERLWDLNNDRPDFWSIRNFSRLSCLEEVSQDEEGKCR